MKIEADRHVKERPDCSNIDPMDGAVDRDDRIGRAIGEFLTAIEAGTASDPSALLAKYSDVAKELAACIETFDFMRNVAPQLAEPSCSGDARASSAIFPLATLGDFRILREIGRGGMGIVYEAEQLSLGRRMALKVLPFATMLDKLQLNRFKNEARAAASLDHPHIVAVHSVGEDRGVHYYAMQLIDGQSLAEVIGELRIAECGLPNEEVSSVANVRSSQSAIRYPISDIETHPIAALSTVPIFGRPDSARSVAELGIQAAQALDHAHLNGIVHRDVKPGNLLVNAEGKLWVTDFGLARIEANAGMTMTGDLLGTLRYMSPEQILANRVVVDHRTDVYSLGATLYELLTLRPAFAGENRQELLRQIAFDVPTNPRRLDAAIPRELETIVLKAMAKDPTDRFASAQEMTDDLRRFMDHKPIRARRATYWQRTTKWCRRHPAWVAASVACGVLMIVILSIATVLISGAQLQAIEERDEANQQRRRATQNFDLARQAVNQMYTRVAGGTFSEHYVPTELQLDILKQTLDLYEELVRENGDSPLLLADQGTALLKMSYLTNEMDQPKQSESAARKAIKIFEELVARDADVPHHRLHLARAWRCLAYCVGAKQQTGLPSGEIENSAAVLEKLVEDHPTFPEGYEELARTIHHLAWRAVRAGDRQAAEKIFRRAAELIDKSAALGNTSARLRVTRGYNRGGFGAFLAREDPRAGEPMLREAVAMAAAMVEENPNDPNYRHELNDCCVALASALERMDRVEESNGLYRKAADNWRELVGQYPRVILYRMCLSNMLYREVRQLIVDDDHKEAESLCRDVIEMRQAIRTLSSSRRMESPLAASHQTLAEILAAQGESVEALAAAEMGLKLFEKSIAGRENLPRVATRLDGHRHQVAKLLLAQSRLGRGDVHRAAELARVAASVDKPPAQFFKTLAAAELRGGNWRQAANASSDYVMALLPESRTAEWGLAAASWKFGSYPSAMHWLRIAWKHK